MFEESSERWKQSFIGEKSDYGMNNDCEVVLRRVLETMHLEQDIH